MVDQMKKYTHFFSLSQPSRSIKMAETFMETIQKLHGILKIVLTTKYLICNGNFWNKLYSCLGTQLAHNSSYHPEYDGKNDIMYICLEGYQY